MSGSMTSIKELSIDGIPVRDATEYGGIKFADDVMIWPIAGGCDGIRNGDEGSEGIKFGGGQFGTQCGYPVAPGFAIDADEIGGSTIIEGDIPIIEGTFEQRQLVGGHPIYIDIPIIKFGGRDGDGWG